jgi:HPt (histidine-containing phosphotransfer) domain-containing protein
MLVPMSAAQDLIDTLGLDVVRELIDHFLSDSPALLGRMQKGAASGDAEAVRIAAHTLSSTARTFGLQRLADVCETIENNPRGPAARVDEAQRLFAEAKKELATLG